MILFLDRWLLLALVSYLDPVERIAVSYISLEFLEIINLLWNQVFEFRKLKCLTFKRRLDLTDKAYCIKSWKNLSYYGHILLFGGTRGHHGLLRKSWFCFRDNTEQIETIILRESRKLSLDLSAVASALDAHGRIVCIGGWTGETAVKTTLIIETKNSRINYIDGPPIPSERCFCAAASTISGDILLSGGGSTMWQGATVSQETLLLPFQAEAWIPAPSMLERRCGHISVTLLDGNILIAGGYGGSTEYLDSVELYDMGSEQFIPLPHMTQARTGLAGALAPDGSIYVLEGSPDGYSAHSSMERFDPREGMWESVSTMRCGRAYMGACFGGSGILYVSGGIDENVLRDSIEWFDPRIRRWAELSIGDNVQKTLRRRHLRRTDHQMVFMMR
eukprot:gene9695-20154_t